MVKVCDSLKIITILDESRPYLNIVYSYFEELFVISADRECDERGYAYGNKEQIQEKTQLKLYYMIVLRDLEKVFQRRNGFSISLLATMCIFSNLLLLSTSRITDFLGSNNRVSVIMRQITCIDTENTHKIESDLTSLQLSVCWLLIDFGVHVIHYFVDSHLILDRSDDFKIKLVNCLILRFRFHKFVFGQNKEQVPKMMHKKLMQELAAIQKIHQEGNDLIYQTEEQLQAGHGDETSPASSKHSSRSSNIQTSSSSSESSEDNHRHGRNTDLQNDTETEKFYFTPMTEVDMKLLFIYFNKNKFVLGRGLRSLIFNIPRLAVCLMLLSLSYSQTALDYFLGIFCIIYAVKTKDIFITESHFWMPILYSIYYIANWMILRIDTFHVQSNSTLMKYICPAGKPEYSGHWLLVGLTVYNIGFILMIGWMTYTLNRLLRVKVLSGSIHSINTADGYQVLDYKLWKRNSLASINFIYKLFHTKLLEIYALLVFVTCIQIKGHIYFITLVLLIVFILVVVEGVESIQGLLKFLKLDSASFGGGRFMPVIRLIRVICWIAMIVESYNIFKTINLVDNSIDLSPGVLMIYYFTLSIGDLLDSDEFAKNREKVQTEENIKSDYIAINYTYQINEEKLLHRLFAFIGKSKLDLMSKECVTKQDFDKVELRMDYNREHILDILKGIYNDILYLIPSNFSIMKYSVVNSLYLAMHNNTNRHRNHDLFVLYKTVLRKNRNLAQSSNLDLKAYFCQDYRQFVSTLKQIGMFYYEFKEEFPDSTKMVADHLQMLKDQYEKRRCSKLNKGTTFKEMSQYEWMAKDFNDIDNKKDDLENKPKRSISKAADVLAKAIDHKAGTLIGVKFEDMKPFLSKKGLITAQYGRRMVALYNIGEESLLDTHGFVEFKIGKFLSMFYAWSSSNMVQIVFWIIALISCIYGSGFTVIIIGILLFAILIEENYGNLYWWRILNILYLFKVMLKMFSEAKEGFIYFMIGDSIWIDIAMMILINVVMFQQRKTGFDAKYHCQIEDIGSTVVRVIVNDDLFNIIDSVLRTHQQMCDELAHYIEKNLKDHIGKNALKVITSKCTYYLVKMYFQIDRFKSDAHGAAINLFRNMKADAVLNTPERMRWFRWRNFAIYTRKAGVDLSGYVYATLTLILMFSIAFLQYYETGRNTMFAFITGSQAISTQTVLTILLYVTLLFLEKCFENVRPQDSITIRYPSILPTLCKAFISSDLKTQELRNAGVSVTKFEKFRAVVRTVVIINRLKPLSQESKLNKSNPLIYKYYFLIVLYLAICFLALVLQPVLANTNQKSLFHLDFNSFMCDPKINNCFSFLKFDRLPVGQIFLFLNIIYFYYCIQEIRQGKVQAIPPAKDFSKLPNLIGYYMYYKLPVLREICTLINYAVQRTTLEFSDSLLCEDISENIIRAKILHDSNNMKNPGKLIPRIQRVFMSWGVIMGLVLLLILPLLLFSKFTTGDKEQEILEGSVKVVLYAGEDRYLMGLYQSNFLLENRRLCNLRVTQVDNEREELARSQAIKTLNRNKMRVVSFSQYSDFYLDYDEERKLYMINHILNSTTPFVSIILKFKVKSILSD